jgi:hypothetical protein
MAFEELFNVYPNKNAELRTIAKVAYEFGKNIALEPSSGMSIGLDEHAIGRQRAYVTIMTGYVEAIHGRPIPDLPYVHPIHFDIDLSAAYMQTTVDGIPLNEDTELLAEYWMMLAASCAKSQSAGLAGSMIDPDYVRITALLAVITQYLDEMDARPFPDVPETAFPGAPLEVPAPSTLVTAKVK